MTILKFVIFFEQGAPHFHFVLGLENYVTGLVLSPLHLENRDSNIFFSSLGTQDSPRKGYANGEVQSGSELNPNWLTR